MKKTEWGWVSKQLAGAKASDEVKDAVVYCLKTLREQELDDETEVEVVMKLLSLVQGHSIAVSEPDERWGPVVPGAYSIGDTVRVKIDAFDGEKGQKHNGKRGRVTASRNGFAVVLLDDSPSSEIQMHYLPQHLERLR